MNLYIFSENRCRKKMNADMDPLTIMLLLLVAFLCLWGILVIDAAERTYWDDDEHEQSWKDRNG